MNGIKTQLPALDRPAAARTQRRKGQRQIDLSPSKLPTVDDLTLGSVKYKEREHKHVLLWLRGFDLTMLCSLKRGKRERKNTGDQFCAYPVSGPMLAGSDSSPLWPSKDKQYRRLMEGFSLSVVPVGVVVEAREGQTHSQHYELLCVGVFPLGKE